MSAFVLLHGFTGDPSSWDEVASSFPGTRILRPCLLGHGPAGAHDSDRTFVEEVDSLAALVQGEGFAGAHLVGYSLGARLAMGLISRHSQLFSRATLVGGHPGLTSEAERRARAESDETWARMIETDGLERFVDAWEAQPLFATQRELPLPLRRRERARRLDHTPAGLARSLRLHGLARMPDWRPYLASVAEPVTLVAGEHDHKFLQLARELRPLFANARLQVVEGAGHNVVLERPHALAALLAEHMNPRAS